MPELFLDKINTEYKYGSYTIKVKSEPYKGFRIFEKIRFSDRDGIPFHYFSIMVKNTVIMEDYESRYDFKLDNIDYVDVYVFRYNREKPLIIGVKKASDYIYYKWIDLVKNEKHGVLNLIHSFVPEAKLSINLIDANDEINSKITFRIDKTENYNNIHVKREDTKSNFLIYTHEPRDSKFQNNESCILINNVLFNPKPSNKIEKEKWYNREHGKIKSICVYCRSRKGHPLLVKLAGSQNDHYYFYRRNKNTWIQIEFEDESEDLYHKLEEIEFRTNYSMNVLLNEKSPYTNDSFKNDISSKNRVPKIDVSQGKDRQNIGDYEFFVHELEEYSNFVHQVDNFLGKFIVLRFLISHNEIEISGIEEYILYVDSRLYVYFYKNDNVPLLFSYNGKYFGPESRESYFDKWVEKQNLASTPCDNDQLRKELDKINKMLNEVNIDKISDYGMDYNVELNDYDDEHVCLTKECEIKCKENRILKLNSSNYTRIKVEYEKYEHFAKYTHTTKNKFYIGNISYDSKKILDDLSFVYNSTDVSVTVYYFDFNSEHIKGYPLLLVCKTKNTLNYQYISDKYRIDTQNERPNFKKIDDFSIGIYNFLEHQNFFLNDVICFSMEKTYKYSCCNSKDPYCKNKVVQVEKVEIGEYQVIVNANYKTYSHCAIQENDEKSEQIRSHKQEKFDVSKPRLVIKAMNLKIGSKIIRLINTADSTKDPLFENNDAYVHFYGDDPRPLLVYCNGSAFAPEGIKGYKNNWSLVKDIDYSRRGDGNYRLDSVLNKLHEISYKLNPVDISKSGHYVIDTYFWENISIKVSSTQLGKYKSYIHTALKGHKLGEVTYNKDIIVDPWYPNKSYEIKNVYVYYYTLDKEHKYPLLIILVFDNVSYNIYYLLNSINPLTWIRPSNTKLERSWKEHNNGAIFQILDLLSESDFISVKKNIFKEFQTSEEEVNKKYTTNYSYSGGTTAEQKKNEVGESDFTQKCIPITRGDSTPKCHSISTRGPNEYNYLLPFLDSIEEGSSESKPKTRRSNRSGSDHVSDYLPTNVATDVNVPETAKPVDEYDNKVLLYQIGGSLGALFAIGLCILLLYLFFKIYLKDMRPSL